MTLHSILENSLKIAHVLLILTYSKLQCVLTRGNILHRSNHRCDRSDLALYWHCPLQSFCSLLKPAKTELDINVLVDKLISMAFLVLMNDSVLFGKKSVTFWTANYLAVRCTMKRDPPMSGIIQTIQCIIDISV